MPFKIHFTRLRSLPAGAAIDEIRRAPRKRVDDLRIYDLLYDGRVPIVNGVYLFFSQDGKCLYVGKNSAMKFVERIPWHFSISESAWMNHLLKHTRKKEKLGSLADAAEVARNYSILLIPVDEKEHELIGHLEKFLRIFMAPAYNASSQKIVERHSSIDLNAALVKILREFA